MQLCAFDGFSSYFAARALDFIAGYPAMEGKLTYNPRELEADGQGNSARWLGRIRCIGYAISHALSIPISPLVALVRVVAMPILLGKEVMACHPEDRSEASKFLFVNWLRECASIVTSPLLNIAGVARASLGIIVPSLYLKAPYVSQLSESQRNQAADSYHRMFSPSA